MYSAAMPVLTVPLPVTRQLAMQTAVDDGRNRRLGLLQTRHPLAWDAGLQAPIAPANSDGLLRAAFLAEVLRRGSM